jgi:hypothetical protein
MKKYLFHILTVTLLASFVLGGCESLSAKSKLVSNINSSDTNSSVSSSTSSAAAENSWVYYVNSHFSKTKPEKGAICKLFRARSDGTEKAQVGDVETESFVVFGDWIYYNDWNWTGIYKIHGDGTDKTKLNGISDVIIGFCKLEGVYDNHLYLCYVSKSDSPVGDAGRYIYRMNLDGTGLEKVYDEPIYVSFQLSDGYIYYGGGENDCLYRIRTDGTENTKLTDDSVGISFSISDGKIYYIKYNNIYLDDSEGSVYKINIDGTEKTALKIADAGSIKIFDGLLYFSVGDEMYKSKLDGTKKIQIDFKGWETTKVFGKVY